ncbi:Hypothetical protein A7982_10221 [Minicystis rosea]|nr:Hypothetical protein A7982_10221 [Minicystis rosea]
MMDHEVTAAPSFPAALDVALAFSARVGHRGYGRVVTASRDRAS